MSRRAISDLRPQHMLKRTSATSLVSSILALNRPCRAAQRLRRLAEGADEGAAHPLRIAKAGQFRNAFDRLAGGLHALPRHLDPQALDRLRRGGAGLGG